MSEPVLRPALACAAGAVVAAMLVAIHLVAASHFALTEPDEGRYAEIAREMVESGDWVTPRLNYVKYFEKPPLVYWTTGLAFLGFGQTELAARMPSLLAGLLAVALAVGLAARMYGAATALLALPIVAAAPLFGMLTQVLTLDMALTGWLTLAMAAVWFGWAAPAHARGWYCLAYVATGLATLVKGPVAAVLIGGATLPFLVLHGGWRAVRPALEWRGLVLALLVVLPWFALVSWRNPEFLHFFVVDQHIARYLWTTEHGQPLWFFLPVLPVALLPWALLPLLDPSMLRGGLDPRTWSPATRFLALWAAAIVVFFSLSTSKLLTYVLPAMPPLAILLARLIVWSMARGRSAAVSRLAVGLLIAAPIVGLCAAVLPLVRAHWRMQAIPPYLYAGGAVLFVVGLIMRRLCAARRPYAALAALSVGWLAFFAVAIAGRGVANEYRALALAARAEMQPEDRLVLHRGMVQGIGFYTGRRVIMARGIGELKFGSQQGDQRAWFWPTDDDLRREWAAPGRMFVVMVRSDLDLIGPTLDPPPIIVAAKDKKVLITNR
ncbi:MAG: glycosyltransferase family 39 protein [Candidatus Binatia bacterium]